MREAAVEVRAMLSGSNVRRSFDAEKEEPCSMLNGAEGFACEMVWPEAGNPANAHTISDE